MLMKIAKFSEYIPFIDIYGRSKDKEKQMPTCIGGRFANVFSEEKKKHIITRRVCRRLRDSMAFTCDWRRIAWLRVLL